MRSKHASEYIHNIPHNNYNSAVFLLIIITRIRKTFILPHDLSPLIDFFFSFIGGGGLINQYNRTNNIGIYLERTYLSKRKYLSSIFF